MLGNIMFFNVRSLKKYVSTDTQFHLVPKSTLAELRKNAKKNCEDCGYYEER